MYLQKLILHIHNQYMFKNKNLHKFVLPHSRIHAWRIIGCLHGIGGNAIFVNIIVVGAVDINIVVILWWEVAIAKLVNVPMVHAINCVLVINLVIIV